MEANEIIKALKICTSEHLGCEDGCPRGHNGLTYARCKLEFLKDVFDLVDRQNAEIKKLKAVADAELDTIHNLGDDYARVLEEMQKVVEKAKVDAIREYADKLCGEMWGWLGALVSDNTKLSIHSKIHNLADKLTEKGGVQE